MPQHEVQGRVLCCVVVHRFITAVLAAFAQLAKLREEAVAQAEQQHQGAADRLAAARDAADAKNGKLVSELRDTQQELKQVSAAKFEAEIQVGRLTSELAALKADLGHLRAENAAIKSAREDLVRDKHSTDKRLSESQSQVIALKQQVADKEETIKQLHALADGLRTERATCEESLRLFKDSNIRLQGTVMYASCVLSRTSKQRV